VTSFFLRERTALLLSVMVVALWGAYLSYTWSVVSFGFGDNVFMHVAASWLRNGEVYVRDFVHFRTPGAYYYYAAIQWLLGEDYRATSTAILSENYVFQSVAGVIFAFAASKRLIGKPSWGLVAFFGLIPFLLTPIYQLRTALPLLVLAAYCWEKQEEITFRSGAVGLLLGCVFWVGQEIFIFLAFAIFIAEVISLRELQASLVLRRLLIFGLASSIPLVVGFAVYAALGVNLGEMLYHFLWYALFIQPTGMDLPYPALTVETLQFYTPLAALICASAILLVRSPFAPLPILLITYAGLRMISAFGRSDYLHVVFAQADVWMVLGLAFLLFKRRDLILFCVIGGMGTVLYLALSKSSLWMLAVGPLFLLASLAATTIRSEKLGTVWIQFAAPASGIALMVLAQWPDHIGWMQRSFSLQKPATDDLASGVRLPGNGNMEFREIEKWVGSHQATSVFSYPSYAVPYSFVEAHPTRFFYLEPHITDEESREIVAQLSASPPDLIVQDFRAMRSMGDKLLPIADHIASNYTVERMLRLHNQLELLVPREKAIPVKRLVHRAYVENPRDAVEIGLEQFRSEENVIASLRVRQPVRFVLDDEQVTHFQAGLIAGSSDHASQARALIRRGGEVYQHEFDANEGPIQVPLPTGEGTIEIELLPGNDGSLAIWLDPTVFGSAAQ